MQNNPIRYNDPTGHKLVEDYSNGNCSTSGYCSGGSTSTPAPTGENPEGGNPADEDPEEELKIEDNITEPYISFDGGWSYPQYSTWNLLRMGAPCSACHVTHWTGRIPTNSGIDLNLIQYYRSLDPISHQAHWAALAYIGTASYLARETVVIGHYNQNPNYVQTANKIGADYFQIESGLSADQVVLQNEKFIVNNVQNGSRFVQSSFPVKPNSGLEFEIGWLAENGYTSGSDMFIEIISSFFRSSIGIVGVSGGE